MTIKKMFFYCDGKLDFLSKSSDGAFICENAAF